MTRWLCLTLFPITLISGCASLGGQSKTPIAYESDLNPAVRCLCLWSSGEAEGNGSLSRGFVGQLYFFNASDAAPVAVNGDLRVFVFDDQGTQEEQARPIHEFEIPADTLQGFVKPTQLGPAYDIFVPYPRSGRDSANCSLRVRLTRADGSRVFSDMAEIKLAGPDSAETIARNNARDLPVAEELPQHIRTRSETLGVQKDGAILPASDSRPASADNARLEGYQQRIDSFMRDRASREPQVRPQTQERFDRSGFKPVNRKRTPAEPEPFDFQPEDVRPIETPEQGDAFEIRTLSRPLSRLSDQPTRNSKLDTKTTLAPSSSAAADHVLSLPEPEPFAPVGDQAALECTGIPVDVIELPLPAIEGT